MTTISAALVKELRERTGVAMMACKKALVEAGGDIDKAIEDMRKSGAAKAVKKAGRVAAEGAIVALHDASKKTAVIVEVNCETDFVARDENFLAFANGVAKTALATGHTDLDTLKTTPMDGDSANIEDVRLALVTKIGENVNIRRAALLKGDNLGVYSHGGRIAVISTLTGGDADLARDISMHVAASNPAVAKPEDVSESMIDAEKAIFVAQAKESGKPDNIIEKMITGRVQKFLNEVSLTGQPFIKDPSQTVGALLQSKNATVDQFIRFEVGEGIEKKVENFAEEVMAQTRA
ncbi:MAG: elongation factor Ts [marine bacterium B5-7]|nr:MAG: elongation factor Ts [marine bacterium B5-7]